MEYVRSSISDKHKSGFERNLYIKVVVCTCSKETYKLILNVKGLT